MEKLTTTLLTGAAMSALAVAPAMAGHQHQGPTRVLPLGHSFGIAVKTQTGIKVLSGLHQKTNLTPGKTNFYTTYTFTTGGGFCYHAMTTNHCSRKTWNYAAAEATWYKHAMDLAGAVAWETSGCTFTSTTTRGGHPQYNIQCHINNAPGFKGKASKRPAHGQLKQYTVASTVAYTITFTAHTFQCTTYTCRTGTGVSYYEVEHVTPNLHFDGPAYTLKSKTATSDSGQNLVSDKLTFTYTTTTTGVKHKHHKHTDVFNGRIYTNLAMTFSH